MADRGRLVVPAEVRERLHLRPGDTLTLTLEANGTAILHTRASAIARLRGAFKDLSPGRNAVDELIAERRREAAMEERDTRALARRPRTHTK
jgi:AbrB family looped-hinge helix DNA binding protein